MNIEKTETHSNLLKEFYQSYAQVDLDILKEIFNSMQARAYKRRFHLLRDGDPVVKHYFILKGCVRLYFMNEQGQEANVYFGTEGYWLSFFLPKENNITNDYYVECIENCEFLEITRDDFYNFMKKDPTVATVYIERLENMILKTLKRTRSHMSESAEDRYLEFIKENKELSMRIADIQIARYLGITPAFLSKMKKRLLH